MAQDLVPCILVTFDKEQIVIWRGKNYRPAEGGYFLTERESFDDPDENLSNDAHGNESTDYEQAADCDDE